MAKPTVNLLPQALTTPPAGPKIGDVPVATFQETDVESLLPETGNGKKREKLVADTKQELEADATTARALIDAFVNERRKAIEGLEAARPNMLATVEQSGSTAIDAIDTTTNSQISAVRVAARGARTQAKAKAAAVRGQIEASYKAALRSIEAATKTSKGALDTASGGATTQTAGLETGQITLLGTLYTKAEAKFKTVAQTAGSLAITESTANAAAYRSKKINREDGFWDGHLTDNRCEAQAEAAEKVGKGYRDELIKEGDKQAAELRKRMPTDEGTVRRVAGEARTSLTTLHTTASTALADSRRVSLQNAIAARTQGLGHVDKTLRDTLANLTKHETAQVKQVRQLSTERKDGVRRAVALTKSQLGLAIDRASTDTGGALTTFVAQMSGAPVPEPKQLSATLADTGEVLTTQFDQIKLGLDTQVEQAGTGMTTSATEAAAAIVQAGTAAVGAAELTGASAGTALGLVGTETTKGIEKLAEGHGKVAGDTATGHATAATGVVNGLKGSFGELNRAFTEGASSNAEAVSTGLTNAVKQDMPGVISKEAADARSQVQPRWKSVLKWIIIIAIVLVVAIVLGPLVIGAVSGAAAAMGASAAAAGVIGTVLGGALVGAATSAATTVVDNGFSGRALTTGLGTAIALGALGGALGGAVSSFVGPATQGMSTLARYGIQVGTDVVMDTTINAATGNLTWENFATGVLMSAFVNGVTAHPRVQVVQHGFSSRAYGTTYNAVTGARGAGGPGSAGPITVPPGREAHINPGDTTGAGSPYAGKWKWKGGGHNANEFRGRIAGDAGGVPDYQVKNISTDRITGVAIDEASRQPTTGPASGAQTPQIDPATGNPMPRQTERKSLFPPGMGKPEIEVAARRALELSMAGAANSEHKPPTTPTGNGSFKATVTTPDGHPIMVEGHYKRNPTTGEIEIQTVYPSSNRETGQTNMLPGSQPTGVGGIVTPPDYDYGDED